MGVVSMEVGFMQLLATVHLNTSRVPINHCSGLRLQNERFSEPPWPVKYSNAQVLKAPLQNLLAPCHRNTQQYQIKLLYLYSQNKRYSEPS